MKYLPHLFENNKRWAAERTAADPQHFERLADSQDPDYLWIGCADSRVPATSIVGLQPGELFVHRNVANLVGGHDASAQCVLNYAVNALKVDHVIVCGHYGCGGVGAALGPAQAWEIERWIEPIRGTRDRNKAELNALDETAQWRKLCELNVEAQVEALRKNPTLHAAWQRGHAITVHGWMYDLAEGLLHDLKVSADGP